MVDDKCNCDNQINTAFVAINKRVDEILERLLKLEDRVKALEIEDEPLNVSPETINIGVNKNGGPTKNIESK